MCGAPMRNCYGRPSDSLDRPMGRAARQLNLSGVFAAAVTPNRPGTLDIDYSALMDQLDFLANAGVSGICLFGSTGEFLSYSMAERQRAVYLGTKRSRV